MFVSFDVGDTLIQYEGVALNWAAHYRPALQHALSATSDSADDEALSSAMAILTCYNTRTNPRTVEVAPGEVTAKLAERFGVSAPDFEHSFFSYFQRRANPTHGALALLRQLRRAGCFLSALSDVPYGMPTRLLIEDLGELAFEFAHVLSSCDVGVRKPRGDGLRQLLRLSGDTDRPAYYVGNEQKDVEAAHAAGLRSILYSSLQPAPDFGQHHTVHSLPEVADIVLVPTT